MPVGAPFEARHFAALPTQVVADGRIKTPIARECGRQYRFLPRMKETRPRPGHFLFKLSSNQALTGIFPILICHSRGPVL
jgi:hypothetical protein